VSEIAEQSGINRETLSRLLEHHGYLELKPYGGLQNRRLVTNQAYEAKMGHNVDASVSRVAFLEGYRRAIPFPVFYPEQVQDILWTLDYPSIVATAKAVPKKRDRLRWLMDHHPYLPNEELSSLAGYSLRGVEKARLRVSEGPAEVAQPSTCLILNTAPTKPHPAFGVQYWRSEAGYRTAPDPGLFTAMCSPMG
jgi:hypothetical protein